MNLPPRFEFRFKIAVAFFAALIIPIILLETTAIAAVGLGELGVAWVDVAGWFKHDSWFAMPRYVWALLTALAILENLLGRSKDPRVRSVFAAIATALNWFLEKTRISAIPVAGPIIVNVLRAVTGDKDGDGVPDDDKTPINRPAPPTVPGG